MLFLMSPAISRNGWGVVVFLLVTFSAAWAIEWGPVRRMAGGVPLPQAMATRPVIVLLLAGIMYTPTLGALVARLLVERSGFSDAGLRLGRLGYYPLAWLLPVAIAIAAGLISVALNLAHFDPHFTQLQETLRRAQGGRPVRLPPVWVLWTLMPLQVLTFGVAFNCLATFGEEFGWRGYLQMRLLRLGPRNAMLLTGVVWGLWHAPVILQGYNYPAHPRLGVALFVVFCMAWAIILGWLRLRSASLWPCVIAHAALNAAAPLVSFVYFRDYDSARAMVVGAVGIVISLIVAVILIRGVRELR